MGFFPEASPMQIYVSNHPICPQKMLCPCLVCICNQTYQWFCDFRFCVHAWSLLSTPKLVESLIIVDQLRMWCITLEKDQQKWQSCDEMWFVIFWAVDTWWCKKAKLNILDMIYANLEFHLPGQPSWLCLAIYRRQRIWSRGWPANHMWKALLRACRIHIVMWKWENI